MAPRKRKGPGMENETAAKPSRWFSLPLPLNPKAIIPLYLSGLGSLCWEAAALWGDPMAPALSSLWTALVLGGMVTMILGLLGGIVYHHYKVAGLAVIIAIISPPMWFWLTFALHPLFGPGRDHGFPVVLWLYFQISLALLALWRSPWQERGKGTVTALVASGVIGLFTVHTIRAEQEVVLVPHVSDQYLSLVYEKKDTSAIKRLMGRKIVVTGVVGGQSEGLFGGGPPMMSSGDTGIEFDDLGPFDSVADGQKVSILGMCKGEDADGTIHLADCRVVG